MKYAIYGAGLAGKKAIYYLGVLRTGCFIENDPQKEEILDKKNYSFEEFLPMADGYLIVVATISHNAEIEAQLKARGIKRYFVFSDSDEFIQPENLPLYCVYQKPHYMSYNEILANYGISDCKKIVVYGINASIPYLLAEIGFQNDWGHILALVDENADVDEIMGVPVYKELSGIPESYDCLIINKRREESPVRDQAWDGRGIKIVDIFDIDKFIPVFRHPGLVKYKDIHKGKRCFIVGNGPSLKFEDLDMLHRHGEICFGANHIYRAFDRTAWRPDYLAVSDDFIMRNLPEDIGQWGITVLMADMFHVASVGQFLGNVEYIHMKGEKFYPNYPGFADDITEHTYHGLSVTYDISLQLAAYMGFSEIYLIGVDHSLTGNFMESQNHFIQNYYDEKNRLDAPEVNSQKLNYCLLELTKAYEKVEAYSRRHGFRIYNATRGGALEVFERKDFDRLFDLP